MRLLIADDHTLVRAGLRRLLEEIPAVEVIGEADSGEALLEMALRQTPDAVIIDLQMPGLNGLQTAERLLLQRPRLPVVILSMHDNPAYVRRAFEIGVLGFVLKNSAPVELGMALRAAAQGRRFVSSELAARMFADERAVAPLEALTERQRQVLERIAAGMSTREIAADLGLSVKTVETHRARIMERLGLRNHRELMRFAVRASDGDALLGGASRIVDAGASPSERK